MLAAAKLVLERSFPSIVVPRDACGDFTFTELRAGVMSAQAAACTVEPLGTLPNCADGEAEAWERASRA